MNELELLDRMAQILDDAPKGFTVRRRDPGAEHFTVELSSGRTFIVMLVEVPDGLTLEAKGGKVSARVKESAPIAAPLKCSHCEKTIDYDDAKGCPINGCAAVLCSAYCMEKHDHIW